MVGRQGRLREDHRHRLREDLRDRLLVGGRLVHLLVGDRLVHLRVGRWMGGLCSEDLWMEVLDLRLRVVRL